jgi:phospholipase/carboxylesterase
VPWAEELTPESPILGLRGTVAIDGGYAFFHRFPDRRVDEADIEAKASVLAEFVEASCTRYNFARRHMATGFPNGAIMAAALLLAHPGPLSGLILFHRSHRSLTISRTAWTVRPC